MLSKVKNILNMKKWARSAPRPRTNDQTLPVTDPPILPEVERLTLTVEQSDQTLMESCLPVLERRTLEQNDQALTESCLPVLERRTLEQNDQTLTESCLPVLERLTLDQNIQMLAKPCFPPELERLIFEHAARQNRRAIPSLMRVASRVKEW